MPVNPREITSLDVGTVVRAARQLLEAVAAASAAGSTVIIFNSEAVEAPPEVQEKARRLAAGALPEELEAEQQRAWREKLLQLALAAAQKGLDALRCYYRALSKEERALIEVVVLDELVPLARRLEAEAAERA